VFTALFFVSVGMLFNPGLLMKQPLLVLAAVFIVLVLKPLAALGIVMLLRDSKRTAYTVAVGLAQIGEFSFILAALGQSLGALPTEGLDVLVIAAIASIAVNPLLFRALAAWERRADLNGEKKLEIATPPATAGRPVALAGLGEIGRRLVRRCVKAGIPVSVIAPELEALEQLGEDVATVYGDAARAEVLQAAGVAEARILVVTVPSLMEKMRVCMAAREVNPRIVLIAAADSPAERAWLEEFGAAYVCDTLDEGTEALMRSIRNAL
jgi:CPA2 family monovalent cation:H+ antiporter-2